MHVVVEMPQFVADVKAARVTDPERSALINRPSAMSCDRYSGRSSRPIARESFAASERESGILTGARQALAFARGGLEGAVVHVPAEFDVKALRRRLGMSQARFAASFGFGLAAVQSWEQGRRRPEGPARVLLKVIQHDPDAVRRALAA